MKRSLHNLEHSQTLSSFRKASDLKKTASTVNHLIFFRRKYLFLFNTIVILKVFLHKMNFFLFTVLVLIAIEGAYAIRCYKCQPNFDNISVALSKGNFSGLNLCNNPTSTVDCSQDPYIGSLADACYTTSVGLAYNISLVNLQGEIKYHTLDCAMKSQCGQLKKTLCENLKNVFPSMPAGIGFNISQCDVSCCQGDGCNNPSGPPATSPSGPPATSPSGPPATSPSGPPATSPPASSVKNTQIPPNAALFGILSLITMAFTSLF